MAVGVSIVSTFDASGIYKAIRDFKKLETVSAKASFSMRTIDKAVTNGVKNVAKYGGAAAAAGHHPPHRRRLLALRHHRHRDAARDRPS